VLSARLRCRRGLLGHDEAPEHAVERLGLHCRRMRLHLERRLPDPTIGTTGRVGRRRGEVNVLSLGPEPEHEEAPITLPAVIRVEEQEHRQPPANALAAMDPRHV